MPVLYPSKRMAFWALELNGVDITKDMGSQVAGITVEYDANAPTQVSLDVTSMSFLEDFFKAGNLLTVKMGWSLSQMVTMVRDAEVVVNPEGGAREYLSYTVTAMYPAAASKREKSRVFPPLKSSVVAMIAADNGLIPVVNIADRLPIPAKEMPVQMMQTDLQFLMEIAKKWRCIMWVDSETKTLYFMDADKAFEYGSTIKKLNIEDLDPEYQLGYRTDFARNNVANVAWHHGVSKGGQNGQPAVQGLSENGQHISEQNYNLEFEGRFYKVKPEYMRRIKNGDIGLAGRITTLIATSDSSLARSQLRQYFDPLNDSHTNQGDVTSAGAGNAAGVEINVTLNVGDPYLRPPRKARLFSGSSSPNALASDLPGFLVSAPDKPGSQKYFIRKVKTSLQNGMISTDMVLTR